MLKKRGLSTIVTTLLIILLSIVAIAVVWVVIANVVQSGTEQIALGQKCINVNFNSVSVLPVFGQAGSYSVTLSRGSGGDPIAGVKVTVFNADNENSDILEFGSGLNVLETKTQTIITNIINANKFDITPYFTDSSGNEQLCPQTKSFSLGSSVAAPTGEEPGEGDEPVCGNGDQELGEQCDDGNTNDDDNCSPTCQDKGLGAPFCGNNICDLLDLEDANDCPEDCAVPPSCDGDWNSGLEDAGVECDGTPEPRGCNPLCRCDLGFGPDPDVEGSCILDVPLDTGTIFSVWNNIYIDSVDLLKTPILISYIGEYINFSSPSLEKGCFLITFADYLPDNDISYLRLDDSLGNPNIAKNDLYSIWEAENCGQ